jgi:hypothetical protein
LYWRADINHAELEWDPMKWYRVLLLLAATTVVAPACTSPTGPRLPTPDETSKKPPPEKPGLTVPGVPAR